MATFNFSANAVNFGNWAADTQAAAQEAFASDAGYHSWNAMVEQAEEFGGNTVEIREVLSNGQLSNELPAEVSAKHTYAEIASNFALWNEFVNTDAAMTREEFDAMTVEQKVALQVEAFGARN